MNNSMLILTFSVIADKVALAFDVSIIWVIMCAIMGFLVYIPVNIGSVWILSKFDRGNVMRAVAILQFIGAWTR